MDSIHFEDVSPAAQEQAECFPLSFAQEQLCLLDRILSHRAAYNIAGQVRLKGQIDSEILERSVQEIIRRHEILRTSFVERDGAFYQQPHETIDFALQRQDLRGPAGASASPEKIASVLRQEAETEFHLDQPGVLRVALLRVGEEEHIITLVVHHIVADGWSIRVFLQELQTLYRAFQSGAHTSPLSPLDIQYLDYAAWQRAQMQTAGFHASLEFWQNELRDAPQALELPADFSRSAQADSRGGAVLVSFSTGRSDALRAFCRQRQVTPYIVLLAALQAVLARYAGQSDVLVGSPVAARQTPETGNLIGMFANLVVRRTSIATDDTFSSLIEKVKQGVLRAHEHEAVPFEKVVEAASQSRTASGMQLVQNVFAWQSGLFGEVRLGDLAGVASRIDTGTAKFELTLLMEEVDHRFEGWLEYQSKVFSEETARQIVSYFERFLWEAIESQEKQIATISLVSAREHELLTSWNQTTTAYPREKTIAELFTEVAHTRGEQTALLYQEERVSYQELNRRANQLAHYLQKAGVGPEVTVGVCAERSPLTIIAILAVLKAGGVYVPCDPGYPEERLRALFADAGVLIVLTQSHLVDRLPAGGPQLVALDVASNDISRESQEDPRLAISPDNLAYVMYTSGSTGTPKGIGIPHRAVVRLVRNTNYAHFGPEECFLQFAPISFDASTFEIWGALLNGGRLAIFSGEEPSLDELTTQIRAHDVTTLWLTAGLFHLIVQEKLEALSGVRQLLAGGDVIRPDLANQVRRQLPACKLINGYGPTEGTTFSCCHAIEETDRTVPIGRPISNTQVYVLDAELQLAPIGVPGELYAAGDGLGRGYWQQPGLTAERFVPNPLGESGSRLYRTGDRARWLADGTLEFLGRIDQQVKIRGHRIEPGEIETVLAGHEAVATCCVVVKENDHGDKSLVAYAALQHGNGQTNAEDLRSFLAFRLPAYMLPSAIVVVANIPLTRNGKVDRAALPAVALEPEENSASRPLSPLEQQIAAIWGELLDLGSHPVSIQSNFFALGGHSLLASQCASRFTRAFGVKVSLRAIFDHPVLADISAVIAGLEESDSRSARASIPKLSRDRFFPLSSAQERLWFIHQLNPDDTTYNISGAVRLKGNLDPAALERSFQEIVRRHEILRTSFHLRDGHVVQQIHESRGLLWLQEDLRAHPAPRITELAEQSLKQATARRFALETPELLFVSLLRTADEDYILQLVMHHIIADGWSVGLLLQELKTLYDAYRRGHEPVLPALETQYADFAAWQRAALASSDAQAGLQYWIDQLRGAPELLLPVDSPRTDAPRQSGATLRFQIDGLLFEQLRQLCLQHGVTMNMLLLAGFQALLSRLTGETDIVVGSPMAERGHRDTEALIGLFVNMVALRVRVAPDESFLSLLAKVRETVLEAQAHQQVPFEQVVEALQPQRRNAHQSIVQVVFAWQSGIERVIQIGDMKGELQPLDSGTAKFDLALTMHEEQEQVEAWMEYSTALFRPETMQRLAEQYLEIIRSAAYRPDGSIRDLQRVNRTQAEQVLRLGQGAMAAPASETVLQLFASRVAAAPQSPAVVCGAQSLTFAELDAQANRLARYLQRRGIGAEHLVGICMQRSVHVVTAMLAAWKAGAAYISLDPSYPRERLEYILQHAGVRALCIDTSSAEKCEMSPGILILMDQEVDAIAGEEPTAPPTAIEGRSLAYVIYTSGSTGRPKGVQITHEGLLNLVLWHQHAFGLGPGDRATQVASLGFDASVWEIWSAMAAGATLCFAPEEARTDPVQLRDWLCAEQISTTFLPTPLAEELIALEWPAGTRLKTLLTGGDKLRHMPQRPLPFRFYNNYGPTEYSVVTTWSEVSPGSQAANSPAIGKAVTNTQIYLLDQQMQLVPAGVEGELYIGGPGLARGYWQSPAMTAERFLPNPFSSEPGARFYRTGDMVAYAADGQLEFRGRCDEQVKLRGHRIELEEIACVLRRAEGVRDAVVVLRQAGEDGSQARLVAYVLAQPDEVLNEAAIREMAGRELPNYMVPASIVQLEAFPLSANGKLDRKALPPPSSSPADKPQEELTSATEKGIGEVWIALLEATHVYKSSNFFELGGHSLLVTQAVARLQTAFDLKIPLRTLFDYPVLEDLARRIDALCLETHAPAPAGIPVAPRPEHIPLSSAQEQLWFFHQLLPDASVYNIPGAVRLAGALDTNALHASLQRIVERHEILRTSFALHGRKPAQTVNASSNFALHTTDLRGPDGTASESMVQQAAQREAAQPFKLQEPGLLRARLLRVGEQEHVLVVVMHHIVADGWSIGLLIRELSTFYRAYAGGTVADIADLPLQYADYAIWQRAQPDDQGAAGAGIAYWKRQLTGVPALDLATDYARPAVQQFRGAVLKQRLPEELSHAIKAASSKGDVTLFMTLLSALQILVARYSGQKCFAIGSPVANRSRRECEALIGFFVNVVALKSDLSGDPLVSQLLEHTKQVCLEAYAHQEVPFEKVVEALEPVRDPGRNPVFQILFALQDVAHGSMQLPGITLDEFPLENTTAKFDLSLVVEEGPSHLTACLEYNTDLFAAETAARFLDLYQRVLQAMVANPAQRVSQLSMLSPQERSSIDHEWNRTEVEWGVGSATVVDFIEQRVAEAPGRAALVFNNLSLTYNELNRRSNRLARYLRRQGVALEQPVALCMERSLEMVIAILAVLKAGAAYVPIDDSYPIDRIEYMLGDCGAQLVLSQQTIQQRFEKPLGSQARWISIDSAQEVLQTEDDSNLEVPIALDALAYLIYTSGSTGRPKGAMNSHRGLRNRLLWMQSEYQLSAKDCVLQKTPFGFDVSVWEFLWPFMQGARLVVARPAGHRDPGYLVDLIRREQVTTMHFVPSMLQVFVQQPDIEECSSLRQIFLSGEALPADLVEKWEKRHDAPLHNLYGPTEASIDVTYWLCKTEKRSWGIPIGRPIANTRLYVLDDAGQLSAMGAAGELYLGGIGLARGYWRQPGLTADRFVPDPLSGNPGQRLYRTGDRVKLHADGVIQYLGRADDQVKIRGNRIELGEIESVLKRESAVADAAVLVREFRPGDHRLVAYVVADAVAGAVRDSHKASPSQSSLRDELLEALKTKLPEYMVPAAWIFLDALPLSPNGKLDRKSLLRMEPDHHADSRLTAARSRTEEVIAAVWKQILGIEDLGFDDNFFDLGGHSLLLTEVHQQLTEKFAVSLDLVELFQFPTIRALARQLDGMLRKKPANGRTELPAVVATPSSTEDFAIVGMACRFPGAATIEEFWNNLQQGVESITDFSDEDLRSAGVEEELLSSPVYVKRGAVVQDIDMFDARFFNFSAREAEMTDPQHRIFLECAWDALEKAGTNPDTYPGKIGVFAGAFASTYFMNLYADKDLMKSADGFSLFLANGNDFLATRVSYKLNLRGPSMTVQCGCSTSLVAIHTACQSLRNGECDMALAGGVAVKTPVSNGYVYQEGGIFSPDGHCRAFDAKAQGTVGGNGAGVVLLKRLDDALRDRNHIHAVIRGSAVNNDGSAKPGYTAPGIEGQRAVILAAYQQSGIDPASVGYVEAHGTGTMLGDPVELTALTQAFRTATQTSGTCAIGSLKPNVGHLDTAAGVASLIKTALIVEHGNIPPSLHFEEPNPRIDFANSPFYVNTKLTPWKQTAAPRRAGVSSFGIGGTNAHVVLEQAPPAAAEQPSAAWNLLLLSARTDRALDAMTDNLCSFLRKSAPNDLADAAFTLQAGRKHFARRRFLTVSNTEDAITVMESRDSKRMPTGVAAEKQQRIIFLFPGQGSQYVEMGKELYEQEPIFRKWIDYAAERLLPLLGADLRTILFPDSLSRSAAEGQIQETRITQPALFMVEYALAQMWLSWGVVPDGMIGHSIGEYVAACVAGVFTLEDALALVAARGRLMQSCARGSMIAVMATPEQSVQATSGLDLDLAAVNGDRSQVFSGSDESIAAFEHRLTEQNIPYRRLASSHAFHSRMMRPILEEFAAAVAKVQIHPPTIPYVSNVTGDWITGGQVADPQYWARQLAGTVQFAKGIRTLCPDGNCIALELGPGRTLGTATRASIAKDALPAVHNVLAPLQSGESEQQHLLHVLGQVWQDGIFIDWESYNRDRAVKRIILPTYPFERQRYWITPSATTAGELQEKLSAQGSENRCYVPVWKETPVTLPKQASAETGVLLLFLDAEGVAERLGQRSEQAGRTTVRVMAANHFAQEDERIFRMRPGCAEDYESLFFALEERGTFPASLVHAWNVSSFDEEIAGDVHDQSVSAGFLSLLHLCEALKSRNLQQPIHLLVLANGVDEITGQERIELAKTGLRGLCRSLPQQVPQLACRMADILLPAAGAKAEVVLLEGLMRELAAMREEPLVPREMAYRGCRRWQGGYEAISPAPQVDADGPLQTAGVFLIHGWMQSLGQQIAQWLISSWQPSCLILVDEPQIPTREQWDSYLDTVPLGDSLATAIRCIRRWEQEGTQISLLTADLSNCSGACAVKMRARQSASPVTGVFHLAGAGGDGTQTPQDVYKKEILRVLGLERAVTGLELRFFMLCHLAHAQTGSAGLATQSFLDAFAQQRFAREPGLTASLRLEESSVPLDFVNRLLHAASHPRAIVSRTDLSTPIRLSHANQPGAPALGVERTYNRPELDRPFAPPANAIESLLVKVWTESLGASPIGINDNYFELGGDSLIALKLCARARELGLVITVDQLFHQPTIQQLALLPGISGLLEEAKPRSAVTLLPAYSEQLRQHGVSCRSVLLHPTAQVDGERLATVFEQIVATHDSLRLRLSVTDSVWQQRLSGIDETHAWAQVDLADMTDAGRRQAILDYEARTAEEMIANEGPAFRATWIRAQHSLDDRLLIQALDVVTDFSSLRLLLAEINARYQRLPAQPGVGASFCEWRDALPVQVAAGDLRPGQASPAVPALRVSRHSLWFEGEPSRILLRELPARFHCDAQTVLLTAFIQAHCSWLQTETVHLDLMLDLRNASIVPGLDVSRLIGPMTITVPAAFHLKKTSAGMNALKIVKQQLYGCSSAAVDANVFGLPPANPSSGISAEMMFRYTALPSVPAEESCFRIGEDKWEREQNYAFALFAEQVDGKLGLTISFDRERFTEQQIRRFTALYRERLTALTSTCRVETAPAFTPSDFPEAQLSQQDLDSLMAEIAVGM